jgi:hypothetical protein
LNNFLHFFHFCQAISGNSGNSNPASGGNQFGEYLDEEDRAMAELEEEMQRYAISVSS